MKQGSNREESKKEPSVGDYLDSSGSMQGVLLLLATHYKFAKRTGMVRLHHRRLARGINEETRGILQKVIMKQVRVTKQRRNVERVQHKRPATKERTSDRKNQRAKNQRR